MKVQKSSEPNQINTSVLDPLNGCRIKTMQTWDFVSEMHNGVAYAMKNEKKCEKTVRVS